MSKANVMFVVGTGRSGTHFTCRCLREFDRLEDFQSGKEQRRVLYKIAHAAMSHNSFPVSVNLHYQIRRMQALIGGRILVDQHHSNLFFSDYWLRLLPNAIFIYPDRPAVQVVASMLTHKGVLAWYDELKSGRLTVPYPNRFFGLDSVEQLKSEPFHRVCWYRIRAHKKAALAARSLHGDRVRFVDYQGLVRDRITAFSQIFSSDEMESFGRHKMVESSAEYSLRKYRDVLSANQISDIETLESNWLALQGEVC